MVYNLNVEELNCEPSNKYRKPESRILFKNTKIMSITKKHVPNIHILPKLIKNKITDKLTAKDSWLGVCVSVCSFVDNVGVCCDWTIDVWAVATCGDCTTFTFDCITPAIGWLGTTFR